MSFIYVTGAPGAGKSTIQNELQKLGYEAHDIDNPTFGGPYNIATGQLVVIPSAEERPSDWFSLHEWRINHDAILSLKEDALEKNKLIFVCGVAGGDEKILSYFNKVFYLELENEVLKDRILGRVHNDYGHNESELNSIMKEKIALDERYADLDVIHINANHSLEKVIGDILKEANRVIENDSDSK